MRHAMNVNYWLNAENSCYGYCFVQNADGSQNT